MRWQFVHSLSLSLKYSSFSNPYASYDQETDYRQSPHMAIIVNQPLCLRRLTHTVTLAPLDYTCPLSAEEYAYICTIAKQKAEWILDSTTHTILYYTFDTIF